ncbi:MAG TPA: hypothetical protein VEK35_10915 [Roseiarcus sp.]|nr:hypothetical protein [Roseiarcus sp.]
MKHFLIKYRFKNGSPEAWREQINGFISALEGDPELKGRITYRVTKERDGLDYYHLAGATDDQASKLLSGKDFFKRYAEATRSVAGGEVTVVPLEVIAETN